MDLISNRIPNETTILSFRHLLEEHGLGEQVYCFSSRRLRLRRRLRI
jgi:hypothetical protein